MFLMSPPEGVLLEQLILFELLPASPSFIIGECEAILLEEGVDSWDAVVPGLL
jgi:hypothetical protein